MSDHFSENRLSELIADKLLFGLDQNQQEELDNLNQSFDETEFDSYEVAAAIVDLSMFNSETMPESLEKVLMRQGRAEIGKSSDPNPESEEGGFFFRDDVEKADQEKSGPVASGLTAGSDDARFDSEFASNSNSATSQRIREIVAWGCAAAIGFVALMVWTSNRNTLKSLQDEMAELKEDKIQAVGRSAKYADEIVNLELEIGALRKRSDALEVANSELKKKLNPDGREIYNRLVSLDSAIRWKWSPGNQADTKATGEILWDEDHQEGVMRIADLKPNDPLTSQYQLWIIEEAGRPKPVDGGVFDIGDEKEVFIPIDPKLYASRPALFAITEEEPRGVVVSDKLKLHLVAKADSKE